MHKKLGDSSVRSGDLSYQGDIPYHRMSWPGTGESQLRDTDDSWGWARHRSAGTEQLQWSCLVSLGFCSSFALLFIPIILIMIFYFGSIIKLFLPQPMRFIIFLL